MLTQWKSARDIGITTATHLNYAGFGRHEFEWREYAAREELIRYERSPGSDNPPINV